MEAAKLLKIIGDFERIADHAVNLLESAEEMGGKKLRFTGAAEGELAVLCAAVSEIADLSLAAFLDGDQDAAAAVEPLEQVIDQLKEQLRTRHILRLQQGDGSVGELVGQLGPRVPLNLNVGNLPQGPPAAGVALIVDAVSHQNGVSHVVVHSPGPDLKGDEPLVYGCAGMGLVVLKVQRGGQHHHHRNHQQVNHADFAE